MSGELLESQASGLFVSGESQFLVLGDLNFSVVARDRRISYFSCSLCSEQTWSAVGGPEVLAR